MALITPDQAFRIVMRNVCPLLPQSRRLADAAGCVLAEKIYCDRDQPPANRSAMDGYAIRAADIRQVPQEIDLIGQVAAGSSNKPIVKPGTCSEIFTGGNIPPGADTVEQVEHTRKDGKRVIFLKPVRKGQNVRFRGEETRKGRLLLRPGQMLTPARIGICAMVGRGSVRIFPRPKICVIVTGREVVSAGKRTAAWQLADSNGPSLIAAIAQGGINAGEPIIVPDEPDKLAAAIRQSARRNHIVIITGGVSVGKYDIVRNVIEQLGGKIRFHGVNMKPGKPQLFANLSKTHIFGLPGNPLSVLTGLWEFVFPAIRRIAGTPQKQCQPTLRVVLANPVKSKGDRDTYALAKISCDNGQLSCNDGKLLAEPIDRRGSADILAASNADGTIIIPQGITNIPAGKTVKFRPWKNG